MEAQTGNNMLLRSCFNCLCCCGLCRIIFFPINQPRQPATYEVPRAHVAHRHRSPTGELESLLRGGGKCAHQSSAPYDTDNARQIAELGFDKELLAKTVEFKSLETPDTSGDKIIDDEEICPTCLEPYTYEDPKIVTNCGHHFHLPCIYEWLERSKLCPVCFRLMSFTEPNAS